MENAAMSPIMKMILQEMDAIKTQLEKDFAETHSEDDLPIIPEVIFTNHFLPKFSGKETATGEFISLWMTIAGGMFSPIKIINAKNEHVATIPPYKDREMVFQTSHDAEINEILQEFNTIKQISPKAADMRFANDLTSKYLVDSSKVKSKLEQQWIALLEQYDAIPKQNKTSSENARTVIDDDMEFE